MSEVKGTITTNDLMQKLVQAKKVMNKVDSGNYVKGNIDTSNLTLPDENMMESKVPQPTKLKNIPTPSVEKINQSKLPDAIKKAMIENPIPQISLNDSIDMDLVKGAKKLMEREGMISTKSQSNTVKASTTNTSELIELITPIIENVVRKVMDEKLTQILTAQQTQSMNENLVLKVGDSIFKGKITGVNKSK